MRKRIVALVVLAATLAIALFGVPLAVLVARADATGEQTELARLADQVAIRVSAAVVHRHRTFDLPKVPHDNAVGIYDGHGRRIDGRGPIRLDRPVAAALHGGQVDGDSGGRMVVAVPISDGHRVAGVVRVDTPHTETYRRTAAAWLVMAALGAGALVVTWLVARRQARRLAKPLEDMAGAAERLGDGDFSVRSRASGLPEVDSVGRTLDSTAQRLGDLLARERSFAANASHQLRTPLAGLRLTLEAAQDDDEAELRSAVDDALTSVDRLDQTIEDLLSLRQVARRPGPAVDVPTILSDLEAAWAPLLRRQGRTLHLRIDSSARANAAPAAVRQIVAVLLDNAAAHGAGTVTVTLREAGGAIAVDVADEGAAITADPESLFDSPRPHSAGHGIGLSLARNLAENEGGRLRLTAADPPTFTVLLPAERTKVEPNEPMGVA